MFNSTVLKGKSLPGIGILGTMVGTFLAIYLVPDNYQSQGELQMSAIALSVGLLLAPIAAFALFRETKSLLMVQNVIMVGIVYWLLLDHAQGLQGVPGVRKDSVKLCFALIGLFSVFTWSGTFAKPWKIPRVVHASMNVEISEQMLFRLIIIFFVLGFSRYAIPAGFDIGVMIDALGRNRWAGPWSRGALGGWDSFLDHMSYFGYLVPVLTVAIISKVGLRSVKVIFSIMMSIIMVMLLAQSGSRRIVGVVLAAGIIYWMINKKKIGIKLIALVTVAMLATLTFLQKMLIVRGVGLTSVLSRNPQALDVTHFSVDDNLYRLIQMLEIFPNLHDYIYFSQIYYVLVRPIPRVFWPGKPTGPGFELAPFLGFEGLSLTSSILGEWYAAGGIVMIVIGGWFHGRLGAMWSQLLDSDKESVLIVYSIGVLTIFAGLRSMQDLVLMSYMVIAWIIVMKFYRVFQAR